MFSGVKLELESLDEHGVRLGWVLILKIQELNSGTVTEVNNMLLWMSFEEVSTSDTSLDGLTGTLSLWRSRDPPPYSARPPSGSRPTLVQRIGSLT